MYRSNVNPLYTTTSVEFKRKLINQVKEHPQVWNSEQPENDEWNKILKEIGYKEIRKEMFQVKKCSIESIKKIWETIRLLYFRQIFIRTVERNFEAPNWPFFHDMCFMYDICKKDIEYHLGGISPPLFRRNFDTSPEIQCHCCENEKPLDNKIKIEEMSPVKCDKTKSKKRKSEEKETNSDEELSFLKHVEIKKSEEKETDSDEELSFLKEVEIKKSEEKETDSDEELSFLKEVEIEDPLFIKEEKEEKKENNSQQESEYEPSETSSEESSVVYDYLQSIHSHPATRPTQDDSLSEESPPKKKRKTYKKPPVTRVRYKIERQKLIDAVKQHPVIFNIELQGKRRQLSEAWQSVSELVSNIPVHHLKNRWMGMRTQYLKEIVFQRFHKGPPPNEDLDFLLPFLEDEICDIGNIRRRVQRVIESSRSDPVYKVGNRLVDRSKESAKKLPVKTYTRGSIPKEKTLVIDKDIASSSIKPADTANKLEEITIEQTPVESTLSVENMHQNSYDTAPTKFPTAISSLTRFFIKKKPTDSQDLLFTNFSDPPKKVAPFKMKPKFVRNTPCVKIQSKTLPLPNIRILNGKFNLATPQKDLTSASPTFTLKKTSQTPQPTNTSKVYSRVYPPVDLTVDEQNEQNRIKTECTFEDDENI